MKKLIFLAFLAAACESRHQEAGPEITEPVKVHIESFSRKNPTCMEDSMRCAKLSAEFPIFEPRYKSSLRQINDNILDHIKKSVIASEPGTGPGATNLEDLASAWFKEYETYGQETDFPVIWEMDIKANVLYNSQRCISVAINHYAYTGGAHPNSNTTILCFDPSNGHSIPLSEMVNDVQLLEKLAEKKFRENRGLSPGIDLKDAGFFSDNGFHLPANIGVKPEGLFFFYNSYEIAAYAAGSTEFILTWEELGDLLKTERL